MGDTANAVMRHIVTVDVVIGDGVVGDDIINVIVCRPVEECVGAMPLNHEMRTRSTWIMHVGLQEWTTPTT